MILNRNGRGKGGAAFGRVHPFLAAPAAGCCFAGNHGAAHARRAQPAAEAAKLEADRANAAKTDFLRRMSEHLTKPLERDKLLHTLQKHRAKTV